MDSHYGPAWIGFGHTFAAESEHDQAITAYSTAAKLYPGYAKLIVINFITYMISKLV